jgi:ATP-binding cassette subfamily C protein LapB
VPQHNHLFHGTIAQNLRLAVPAAAIEDLHRAVAEAGILDRILEMPDGFETLLKDQTLKSLPAGFLQRLALARAYLKDSYIVLLDEPAQALDEEGDRLLVEALQRMKGKRTVLMVTHRPSHVRICDRMLAFRNGVLALDGAVSEASLRMLEGLQ